MPLIVRVATTAELREQIERFNGFHDGFLKRVEIVSSDQFEDSEGKSRIVNGHVTVRLELAHVNYRPRPGRFSGIIIALLEGVSALDSKMGAIPPVFPSWSIVDATADQDVGSTSLGFSLWTEVKPPTTPWQRELLARFICRAVVFEECENC